MSPDHDERLYESIREQYPPVLTTAQVSELLHLGPRTVLVMAADGRLRASRLPGTRQYNFFREDVIRILDENMVRPGDAEVAAAAATSRPESSKGRSGSPSSRSRRR